MNGSRKRLDGIARAALGALMTAAIGTAALAQGTPVEAGGGAAPVAAELSSSGWAFMVSSLLFVWVLTLWCFRQVLSAPTHSDPGPAAKP